MNTTEAILTIFDSIRKHPEIIEHKDLKNLVLLEIGLSTYIDEENEEILNYSEMLNDFNYQVSFSEYFPMIWVDNSSQEGLLRLNEFIDDTQDIMRDIICSDIKFQNALTFLLMQIEKELIEARQEFKVRLCFETNKIEVCSIIFGEDEEPDENGEFTIFKIFSIHTLTENEFSKVNNLLADL